MKKPALLMCFLLAFSLVVLAGCGRGDETRETGKTATDSAESTDQDQSTARESAGSGSPEQVAQAFWTAAMTGDIDGSWELLSGSRKASLKSKETWANGVSNIPGVSVKAEPATIKGDTATVTVRVFNQGVEATSSEVSLVKENGAWKVDMP